MDNRGRYSLAQLPDGDMDDRRPVVDCSGSRRADLQSDVQATALEFAIPSTLLLVMGISLGSAVGASAIKGTKDQVATNAIAASNDEDKPRLLQLFTLEEGTLADKAIDIGKFQNFWLTLILVMGYIALAVSELAGRRCQSHHRAAGFLRVYGHAPGDKSRRVPCEQASQSRRGAGRAFSGKEERRLHGRSIGGGSSGRGRDVHPTKSIVVGMTSAMTA